MAQPVRGVAYTIFVSLASQSQANTFQSNPTIAAGDFTVSKDGGSLANLATLPEVTPASSKMLKIALSASEMDAENVTIVGSDQAGAEWKDITINIGTQIAEGTLTSDERDAIAAAYLDFADGIETGITPRQAMRAKLAMLAGVIADAGTGTETFKNPAGGTTRVTVTVDSSGNRSAVVING